MNSKTIIYLDLSFFMFSFSFNSLGAIFGIAGIVGFFFYVKAASGTSSMNTNPKKDFEAVKIDK